ncbi:helicase [Thiomicrospira sp. XS5]|uniref:ATP-dependent DNA helicase n=1 Tax=Thiomicrospira sp. XS5 TaxID=1775636 RepID=UPI0007472334|nr:ATP-dependent RecD-like DNA helicase [Thiomicrospira sp. XS5]KUJ75455.1 helicase [Thiomicrospira sp. XS5]
MATVRKQIESANEAICGNIEKLIDHRALLSQNVISQLRNLIEAVSVLIHTNLPDVELTYDLIEPGNAYVKSVATYSFLGKFHKLLQISASHYTQDGDASERLMLKYYEYLLRIRSLLRDNYGFLVLINLENFPLDLDPSLREYHEKIAQRIECARSPSAEVRPERYYIHKVRPFFVSGGIYYEVTFYRAINKANKSDRIIAFTEIDMTDKYAAMLTLQREAISVLDQTMPIIIIRKWEVSIRPCELKNFARFLGYHNISVQASSAEYRNLMHWLTVSSGSLLDLIDMADDNYAQVKSWVIQSAKSIHLFQMLDKVRQIVRIRANGCTVLRYLMLRMNNNILKPQYDGRGCSLLSDLNFSYSCIPFDTMPFCTSLVGHNPRYWDLIESINVTGRNHELLARRVKNNVEYHGILYTPVRELEEFGGVNALLSVYNRKLYWRHEPVRKLVLDMGHVFIQGYEDETVSILNKLQEYASSRIDGYTQAVEYWLNQTSSGIDDPAKVDAIKLLFCQSKVALIYGAAGTGKSTMVNHIAHYFNEKKKLFLAHTNPAIDNLKRRITAQNADFRTISSQNYRDTFGQEYDLLVIDECSTVSNADLIKVLNGSTFKLVVLVGDIFQIESIQFGNWFSIIRSFIPSTSVFELTTPFRATNTSLLNFWDKVRNIDDDLAEVIARNGYSTVLDNTLFETQEQDEIILCLNYDGLYGINNVNRFLQSSNPGEVTIWRETSYKVGDPILFHESDRFRPVIYNNLKGKIVDIQSELGLIQFDVELDRSLNAFDVAGIDDLEWVEGAIVRFTVYDYDASDEDDDAMNTTVPFQVAYAVSIHKAQGLEFDSVKIVITDANKDDISHSIFYTAITRAREHLKIFWTPETQQRVLERLCRSENSKDVSLLTNRRGLRPVGR